MKKIIISLLTLVATVNMMAKVNYTAKATVFFESGSYTCAQTPMIIAEGDVQAPTFDVLFDAETPIIAMYVAYDSKKCQHLTMQSLGVQNIGFIAPAATSTLKVSAASGSTLYLKDLQENVVMALTADMTPYEFTIATEKVGTYIEDRFQLYVAPTKDYTRDAATVVGNWYTICVPGGVDATEYAPVMDVYTVGGYNAAQGLAVDPLVGAMQPGVPYIFLAKATQIAFDYNGATEALDPKGGEDYNYLTGTFEDMQTENVAYVVANNKLNWAAAGTTVPAYRAYLNVEDITTLEPADAAPGRKFLPAPKGVTTDLEGAIVNGLQNGTYMVNGQIVIVKDGKTFNVLGL